MTTITKENLIEILNENPILVEELRSLLLTRELLALPQLLAEFIEATDKRFAALESKFAEFIEATDKRFSALESKLADFTEATDKRFAALERDVGYLKGKALESDLPGRVRARVEHLFNIRRTRVVRASTQYIASHDFDDAIYDAENSHLLTESQRQRILNTDLIVRGRVLDTDKDAYVAVEASFTADDSDIARASRTASALGKVFPDTDVWAAVYCEDISKEYAQIAEEYGVKVIANIRL